MTRPKRIPRPIRLPSLMGAQGTFAAPIRLLSDIRHGFVLEAQGNVVMPSSDHAELFDAYDTLVLFSRVIPEFAALSGSEIDVSPITRLANRLRHNMPIDDAALSPVEAIFEQGQRYAARVTPDQALAILEGRL